jgi:hypothetical protein
VASPLLSTSLLLMFPPVFASVLLFAFSDVPVVPCTAFCPSVYVQCVVLSAVNLPGVPAVASPLFLTSLLLLMFPPVLTSVLLLASPFVPVVLCTSASPSVYIVLSAVNLPGVPDVAYCSKHPSSTLVSSGFGIPAVVGLPFYSSCLLCCCKACC